MFSLITCYYFYLFDKFRRNKHRPVKVSELFRFVKLVDEFGIYKRPEDIVFDLYQLGNVFKIRWIGNDWEIEINNVDKFINLVLKGRNLLRELTGRDYE